MAGKHRAKAPASQRHLPGRLTPPVVAALVVAVLVVAGLVIAMATGGNDNKTAATPPTTSTSSASVPAGTGDSATPTSSSPSPTTATTKPKASPTHRRTPSKPRVALVVVRTPYGDSWVTVRDHRGRALYDALLPRGHSLRYTDPVRLTVVIGNAGATDIYAGSRHIPRGGNGQVLTLVVNR